MQKSVFLLSSHAKGTVAERRQEHGKQCTASSLEAWVLVGAVWRELGTVAKSSPWSTCLSLGRTARGEEQS